MLPLIDAVLHHLATALGPGPAPRVCALHLPPTPWNGSKDGEFGALELEGGAMGLSYVLLDNSLAEFSRAGLPGLIGADALALAQGWRDGSGSARTLGFAAVNALSRHVLNLRGFVPPAATDSIAGLDPQPGEHIGMVGFFPPLVKQVTARGARLTVLELKAELAGAQPGFYVTLNPTELHTCSKVLCSSTALLNHTLAEVLGHCTHASQVALIGPGAGCLPDVLFARGITTLAGSWIVDGPGFAQALRSGAPWSAHARKFTLNQADGPQTITHP
jgi:uncharacterized protein (DUF4213/DUF364 family)